MDKLIIKGGVPLIGEVSVSGAKNAVLPMLCASVMASNTCVTLKNIPHLHDVTTTVRLLRQMGVSVTLDDNMDIQLDPSTIDNFYAPYNLVKTMRSSILVPSQALNDRCPTLPRHRLDDSTHTLQTKRLPHRARRTSLRPPFFANGSVIFAENVVDTPFDHSASIYDSHLLQ